MFTYVKRCLVYPTMIYYNLIYFNQTMYIITFSFYSTNMLSMRSKCFHHIHGYTIISKIFSGTTAFYCLVFFNTFVIKNTYLQFNRSQGFFQTSIPKYVLQCSSSVRNSLILFCTRVYLHIKMYSCSNVTCLWSSLEHITLGFFPQ